jgi:hypothetical protein
VTHRLTPPCRQPAPTPRRYNSLPASSAVVERGFSAHKVLKTKLRNALHAATVDSAMRVRLLSGGSPIQKADLSDATALFEANPPRSGTHPLMLGRMFEAMGMEGSVSGGLPRVLSSGVELSSDDESDVWSDVGSPYKLSDDEEEGVGAGAMDSEPGEQELVEKQQELGAFGALLLAQPAADESAAPAAGE